jgi:hypothetical protein
MRTSTSGTTLVFKISSNKTGTIEVLSKSGGKRFNIDVIISTGTGALSAKSGFI